MNRCKRHDFAGTRRRSWISEREPWRSPWQRSLLSVRPLKNELGNEVHNRMPVILDTAADGWLGRRRTPARAVRFGADDSAADQHDDQQRQESGAAVRGDARSVVSRRAGNPARISADGDRCDDEGGRDREPRQCMRQSRESVRRRPVPRGQANGDHESAVRQPGAEADCEEQRGNMQIRASAWPSGSKATRER